MKGRRGGLQLPPGNPEWPRGRNVWPSGKRIEKTGKDWLRKLPDYQRAGAGEPQTASHRRRATDGEPQTASHRRRATDGELTRANERRGIFGCRSFIIVFPRASGAIRTGWEWLIKGPAKIFYELYGTPTWSQFGGGPAPRADARGRRLGMFGKGMQATVRIPLTIIPLTVAGGPGFNARARWAARAAKPVE